LLYIQVVDIERVGLNKIPPRLNLVSHKRGEDFVRRDRVLDTHLEQSPVFRVHGRIPELIRVHFTETLVALNVQAFARFPHQPVISIAELTDRLNALPAADERIVAEQVTGLLHELPDLQVVGTVEKVAADMTRGSQPVQSLFQYQPELGAVIVTLN
jgi:hypothetical protein